MMESRVGPSVGRTSFRKLGGITSRGQVHMGYSVNEIVQGDRGELRQEGRTVV